MFINRKGLVAVLAAGCALVLAFAPASATSVYHMNGQGSISIGSPGPGMPACPPDCTSNPTNKMSWGQLTVQGLGLLQDNQIAGQYQCSSEGTWGGVGYSSSIKGNTSSFVITFNFVCVKTAVAAAGTTYINGFFTNNASDPRVATHSAKAALLAGVPFLAGYFVATDSTAAAKGPLSANNGGVENTCSAGFAPTNVDGTNITTAAFLGECTTVSP